MNGKIYIICNKVNNKKYIGQTIQEINKRFNQHLQLRQSNKNQLIFKAIKKYGKENFYIKVLKDNINTYKDLNFYEEYYIKEYNSMTPNGYNMCPGGQKWRRAPLNIEENIKEKLILEYKNGKSSRELEIKYNISRPTIIKFLKENKVEIRNKSCKLPNRTSIITKEILIMYDLNNISNTKIAKELNVSERSIRRAKKRFNL